ncbi:flagellar motor protein MotB [Paracoccus ravus]|uniref:flagellar motor protein MotB n=1 Tax=Paracoccus ravus TaxID=2447760 RepID=UPI00106EC159|nr:flagellar motor protein MotB [Paracoccus ravus]
MSISNSRPQIIKRGKRPKPQRHHGAWKIAYADFMTAMMAFFLLLWLLSSSDEDKLTGIAGYFSPEAIPLVNVGGRGVLKGSTMAEGEFSGQGHPANATEPHHSEERVNDHEDEQALGGQATGDSGLGAENPWTKLIHSQRVTQPTGAADLALSQTLSQQLDPFADIVAVHRIHGNIAIEILDESHRPIFDPGSSTLTPEHQKILRQVVNILKLHGGGVVIAGHVDRHGEGAPDSPWTLAADRANAVRQSMFDLGLDPFRVRGVMSRADRDASAEKEMPEDGRRITIEITPEP